jgi:hypothetical protein
MRLNHLIMSILMFILLLAVNQYVPLEPLINLLFNILMIVLIIVYLMQFLGAIKPILPVPRIFK